MTETINGFVVRSSPNWTASGIGTDLVIACLNKWKLPCLRRATIQDHGPVEFPRGARIRVCEWGKTGRQVFIHIGKKTDSFLQGELDDLQAWVKEADAKKAAARTSNVSSQNV